MIVSTRHRSIERRPVDCVNILGRELDAHLVEGPVSWSVRVDDLAGQHMGRIDAAERTWLARNPRITMRRR